jgi:ABC-2 type transport system permease protein
MNYGYEAIAIGRRILLELFRTYRTMLLWVIFPVSMLLLNGFVLAEGSKISTTESFKLAAPATLIGSALFFSCLGGTMSTIVTERENLTIKRLLIAPIKGVSYFLGIFFAYGVIGLGQSLIIYTVAAFWGVRFGGSIALGLVIVLASIGSYVGMGFVLATRFARRAEDVNSLMAAVGVPLLILGGAFFPTTFLSKDLLLITQFNPVYHMSEAFTALSIDSKTLTSSDWLLHIRFLFGFFAIAIASGWLAYKKMLRSESHL